VAIHPLEFAVYSSPYSFELRMDEIKTIEVS
jgi:hypothetical protein